jgi:hypothetical protein
MDAPDGSQTESDVETANFFISVAKSSPGMDYWGSKDLG